MPGRVNVRVMICVLALVTAVALLRASALVAQAPRRDQPARATEAAVRGFYDAVNQILRTGDLAALDAAVAPDLVVHAPQTGGTTDRDGLARRLVAARAVFPDASLVVEDVVANGDRAMARVAVRGGEVGGFAGIPLRGNRWFGERSMRFASPPGGWSSIGAGTAGRCCSSRGTTWRSARACRRRRSLR